MDAYGPDTEGTEAALRRLPGDVGLETRAAETFEARCRIARGRYDSWRRNFDSIDAFMETDSDRGKAIAGNLATEAQAIMVLWARAWVEASGGTLDERQAADLRGRLEGFIPRWRSAAVRVGRAYFRSTEGKTVFDAVLDDLLERGFDRVNETITAACGGGRNRVLPGGLRVLLAAPISVLVGLWRRVFDPER